jgi:Protein of unknown function (DUF3285)
MQNSPDPKTVEANLKDANPTEANTTPSPAANEPPPSYVKLAMRNMVKKKGTSLKHFALTTMGLLAVLVGLAYLTR